MDPLDFFKTAKRLNQLNDESDLRSAMSRAYYGVLHYLCDYIVSIVGFDKKKIGTAIHKFVYECFNVCEKEEAKYIANNLSKLKQKRTDADYHLHLVLSESKCKDCIKWAQKIINQNLKDIKSELFEVAEPRAKTRGWIS